jgi:hypothetical protein
MRRRALQENDFVGLLHCAVPCRRRFDLKELELSPARYLLPTAINGSEKFLAVPQLSKHCMVVVGTCRDALLSVGRKAFCFFAKEGRRLPCSVLRPKETAR